MLSSQAQLDRVQSMSLEFSPGYGGLSYHLVAADLWFPDRAQVNGPAPGLDDPNLKLHAQLRLDLQRISYRTEGLALHSVNGSTDIDGAALRSLSLTQLKDGLGDLGKARHEIPKSGKPVFSGADISAMKYTTRWPDERLREVAQVYTREALSGRRPAKGVSKKLGIAISTAGVWIREAKAAGYIRQGAEEPDDGQP